MAFLLLAPALLLLPPAGPAAATGERPYEWNVVVNGANLVVSGQQSVAQSFLATGTYVLLNVSLRLQNTGSLTDSLNVSVRADAGSAPAAAYLAATDVVSDGTVRLVSVPFPAPPVLAAGARYWIVATKTGAAGDGYRWFHANADVYTGGWAATDAGTGWANRTTDLWFLTYGREEEANLTAGLSVSPAIAQEKDRVTLTVCANNSGTLPARRAWLNVTLPAGLTYVSDTAAAMGSTTPFPAFTFHDVGNGDGAGHAFRITAQVDVGVPPATVLTAGVRLEYVGGAWAPRPPSTAQAGVTVGVVTKPLYLDAANRLVAARPLGTSPAQLTVMRNTAMDFDLAPALARPFRVLAANSTLWLDAEKGNVQTLNWNLTLYDFDGVTPAPLASSVVRGVTDNAVSWQAFTFPIGTADVTVPRGHVLRLRARLLGNSTDNARIAVNATGSPSRVDVTTTTYVHIDALELRDGAGAAAVWSPKDPLVVRANVSDPFTTSEIAAVRITLRDPSGLVVANGTPMAVLAEDPGSPPAWRLVEFRCGPPLANGTYRTEVAAVEGSGAVDVAAGAAAVRAPRVTLEKVATVARAASGDRFTYHLWYNNTGTGPASGVWINDSLPAELAFLGSSDPGAMTVPYNWTWASVGTGAHRLDLDVRVQAGVTSAFIENLAILGYADEKGHPWSAVSASADVAVNGPYLTVGLAAGRTDVHANDSVPFTIDLTNVGDTAGAVWANDTLPAGLTYVSDTAATLNGTVSFAGRLVLFRFPSMPAGASWTFALTARVGAGLPAGTVLANALAVEYTNLNGVRMPPRNATSSLTLRAPSIPVAVLSVGPATATPGDLVPAALDWWNLGNEAATAVTARLALDAGLAVADASVPWAPEAGNAVRLDVGTAAAGPNRVLLNLTLAASAQDRAVLGAGGALEYSDGAGNPLPPARVAPDAVQVAAPAIAVAATPGDATVEAGTRLDLTVDVSNGGTGDARDLWVNATLPASLAYAGDTSDGARTVTGTGVGWHWRDIPAGPRSFTLSLLAKPGVADGSSADVGFEGAFTDGNGNLRSPSQGSAHVRFAAPVISLTLAADRTEAEDGALVTYTVRLRNNGSATAATVWVSDALDPRLALISWDADAPAAGTSTLNWTFSGVAPGREETITVVARVQGSGAEVLLPNAVEATFTNGAGTVIGYARTPTVTVRILPGPPVALAAGVAAIATAVAAAAVVLWRRRGDEIEEVFLVYRDGILLYHLSRSLTGAGDDDTLTAMLTLVQDFVRDAFKYGSDRRIHQLDFGEYRIVIERGANVYLAVVTSGTGDDPELRKRLRQVIARLEVEHGDLLAAWNGDMDKVLPLRDAVRRLVRKGRRGGPPRRVPPKASGPAPPGPGP